MSKKLKFLAMMLTCILLSINQVFATDDVSTITSSSFEGLTSHWSASTNAGGYDATKGAQITKAKTGLTLTATDFTNVTSISVTCSKSSKGAGAVTITAGANSASKNSFTTSPVPLTLTPASSYTGTITIAITCTNSSIYIKTITVVYTSGTTYTVPFVSRVFSLANQLIFSLLGYVCDMVKLLFLCHTTILIINQLRFVLFSLPRKFKFFTMSMYIAILFLVLIAYTIVYAYAYVHMRMRLFFQTAVHRTVFPFWSSLVTNHLAFPKIEFFILF